MEKTYFLTVFDRSGETLLNEKITTDSDEKAKELGRHRLIEQQYTKHSTGSLMMQASFFYLNVKKRAFAGLTFVYTF